MRGTVMAGYVRGRQRGKPPSPLPQGALKERGGEAHLRARGLTALGKQFRQRASRDDAELSKRGVA